MEVANCVSSFVVLGIGFTLAIISLSYEYFGQFMIKKVLSKKNETSLKENIIVKKELLEMITELKCHQDAIEKLQLQIEIKKEFLNQLK